MPRRKPNRAQPPPLYGADLSRAEIDSDGEEYIVRTVPGARATKAYRCPGCDHEIMPGIAHVVAWPVGAADDRRHWHSGCWGGRATRGLTRRWS